MEMITPRVKITDTFNHWTVTAGPTYKGNRSKHWVCTCTCGVVREVLQYSLLNDKSKSCGCVKEISNETRELLSKLRKGQPAPMKGQTQSEETKQKISAAHMGKKRPGFSAWTPERRAKLAASKENTP